MRLLAGPFLAAAVLLVLAGIQKLRDPVPLVRAVRAMGGWISPWLVRAVAAAEVALGVTAPVLGTRETVLAVAAAYAVFAGFVVVARRRGDGVGSCGCFGPQDVPPSRGHVVANAGLAALACLVGVETPCTARVFEARSVGALAQLAAGTAVTLLAYRLFTKATNRP